MYFLMEVGEEYHSAAHFNTYLSLIKNSRPHTRQRGYLFAVKRSGPSTTTTKKKLVRGASSSEDLSRTDQWEKLLMSLKRPASAALDAFMLPNDDPRVLKGRMRLTAGLLMTGDGKGDRAGRTDWTRVSEIEVYFFGSLFRLLNATHYICYGHAQHTVRDTASVCTFG